MSRRGDACVVCGKASFDDYMVINEVWVKEAGFLQFGCIAHLRCLEQHLGRPLTIADFPNVIINATIRVAFEIGRRHEG